VMQMRQQFLRKDLKGAPAYGYTPGQRRVRLAPEFAYDGVSIPSGGVLLYDEIQGFDGAMDRFDFKLIGRQELYIPYNAYKFYMSGAREMMGPKHVKPEYLRWELHRVWKVEATLKPGERHVEKTKVFYIDEDTWNIISYYALDNAGKIYHVNWMPGVGLWPHRDYRAGTFYLSDLSKGNYIVLGKTEGEQYELPRRLEGNMVVPKFKANWFTPENMQALGVR